MGQMHQEIKKARGEQKQAEEEEKVQMKLKVKEEKKEAKAKEAKAKADAIKKTRVKASNAKTPPKKKPAPRKSKKKTHRNYESSETDEFIDSDTDDDDDDLTATKPPFLKSDVGKTVYVVDHEPGKASSFRAVEGKIDRIVRKKLFVRFDWENTGTTFRYEQEEVFFTYDEAMQCINHDYGGFSDSDEDKPLANKKIKN